MIKSHRDLIVWQKGTELVLEIYRLTENFPKRETYSLVDQLRRAAVSIPSNIAEGRGRSSTKDFVRFLYMAKGSLAEIDTQLFICEKLGYFKEIEVKKILNLCEEIAKMLSSMISKLNN